MLTIIGCGNLNRRDDGVGALIAQRLIERLRRHPIPHVQAFDCGTAGMEVMFAAAGSDALLILDASHTGSPPGTIYEVPGEELASIKAATYTLHDFRWQHALAAGRALYKDCFPTEAQVWLIEAKHLDLGCELSPDVELAAERLFLRLLRRIAAYAAARHQAMPAFELHIRKGNIQVPAAIHRDFLDSQPGVAILAESDVLKLMPVAGQAGGLLVKQRNGQGDRAIDASATLRRHGWDDLGDYPCATHWNSELGALVLARPEGSR